MTIELDSKGDILFNGSNIPNIGQDIARLVTDISSIDANLTNKQSKLNNIDSSISIIESSFNSVNKSISSLREDISGISGELYNAKTILNQNIINHRYVKTITDISHAIDVLYGVSGNLESIDSSLLTISGDISILLDNYNSIIQQDISFSGNKHFNGDVNISSILKGPSEFIIESKSDNLLLQISGDLVIDGSMTFINSNNINVSSKTLKIDNDPDNDTGISIGDGTNFNESILYNNNVWKFSKDIKASTFIGEFSNNTIDTIVARYKNIDLSIVDTSGIMNNLDISYSDTLLQLQGISDSALTESQINALLSNKAKLTDIYTKDEIHNLNTSFNDININNDLTVLDSLNIKNLNKTYSEFLFDTSQDIVILETSLNNIPTSTSTTDTNLQISSITKQETGVYRLIFNNPISDSSYSVILTPYDNSGIKIVNIKDKSNNYVEVQVKEITHHACIPVDCSINYSIFTDSKICVNGIISDIALSDVFESIPTLYEYNFIEPGVSWSDPIFTFTNGTTGNATGNATDVTGHLSWNQFEGLTTPAYHSLEVPSFEIGGSFSIELVFKFNEFGTYNRLIGFGNTQESNIVVARNESNNGLWFHTDYAYLTNRDIVKTENSVYQAPMNAYVHVVLTNDSSVTSGQCKAIYLNGSSMNLINHQTASRPHIIPTITRTIHWIGKDAWGDTGNETIKFVKFYDSVLNQEQVTTLYNKYIQPHILAYYHQGFSPLYGTTMTDIGPNGNNGTVIGSVVSDNPYYLDWTGDGEIDTGITFQNIIDRNGTGEYTMAAKFQYSGNDNDTHSSIFGSRDIAGGGTEFFIGKHYGNTALGIQDGNYISNYIVNPGIFDSTGRESEHTIVVTRSGSPGSYTITTYIDGNYKTHNNFSGVNTTETILIGNEHEANKYPFKGKIWQAIILDKVLSDTEITKLHEAMELNGVYLGAQ